jgi:hypothetical protein
VSFLEAQRVNIDIVRISTLKELEPDKIFNSVVKKFDVKHGHKLIMEKFDEAKGKQPSAQRPPD